MNSPFYTLKRGKKIVYQRPKGIDLSDLVDVLIALSKVYVVGTYPKMESAEDLQEALDFRDWLIKCNLIRY